MVLNLVWLAQLEYYQPLSSFWLANTPELDFPAHIHFADFVNVSPTSNG